MFSTLSSSSSSSSSALIFVIYFLASSSILLIAVKAQPDLSCGTSDVVLPQIRPIDASQGDFPWLVRLSVRCSGTILGRQWIITAAHCLYARGNTLISPDDLFVYVNDVSLTRPDPNERLMFVDKIVPHPLFNPDNYDYDFALIHLTEQLTWSGGLKPICLLQDCDAELKSGTNTTCLIAGWGSDRVSYAGTVSMLGDDVVDFQVDDRLKKQSISIIDRSYCQNTLRQRPFLDQFTLTTQMTCAGYMQGGIDECQSDSGGPMICRSSNKPSFYLHGISSFGFGCGLPFGYFRVYSRPCAITQWILASTRPRAP